MIEEGSPRSANFLDDIRWVVHQAEHASATPSQEAALSESVYKLCTPTDIPRLEYMLASEAMTKKRPPPNTTSLWFRESRAAEKLLREARKKKRKKT